MNRTPMGTTIRYKHTLGMLSRGISCAEELFEWRKLRGSQELAPQHEGVGGFTRLFIPPSAGLTRRSSLSLIDLVEPLDGRIKSAHGE